MEGGFEGEVVANLQEWAECLPGLRELCIEYTVLPPRVRAIPSEELVALSRSIWPDLEILSLSSVMVHVPTGSEGEDAFTLRLWEVLKTREEHGCARLQVLGLNKCVVAEDEIALLRSYAERVAVVSCESPDSEN